MAMQTSKFVSNGNVRSDLGDLSALVSSIREEGVRVPILYYTVGDKNIVWDGHRRLAAAEIAGVTDVPAVEMEPPPSHHEAARFQILSAAEGLRKPLNPMEESRALASLLEHEDGQRVAASLGVSESYVSRRARLVTLHPDFQEAVANGTLAPRAAEALLTAPEMEEDTRRALIGARTFRGITARVRALKAGPTESVEAVEIKGDPLLEAYRLEWEQRVSRVTEDMKRLKNLAHELGADTSPLLDATVWLREEE